MPRIPASNTKILTAAAALETLGANYTFHTDVIRRSRGQRRAGRPALPQGLRRPDHPAVRTTPPLARQVQAAGISRVTGRLVVDATYFDTRALQPQLVHRLRRRLLRGRDLRADRRAQCRLRLRHGDHQVQSRAGRAGKAKITTIPAAAASYLEIVKNLTTTSAEGTSTSFSASRRATAATRSPSGAGCRWAGRGSWLITVHRPELYAAAVFRAELAKAEDQRRRVDHRRSTTPVTQRAAVLARDRSMPLAAAAGAVHEAVQQHARRGADQDDGCVSGGLRHLERRPGGDHRLPDGGSGCR